MLHHVWDKLKLHFSMFLHLMKASIVATNPCWVCFCTTCSSVNILSVFVPGHVFFGNIDFFLLFFHLCLRCWIIMTNNVTSAKKKLCPMANHIDFRMYTRLHCALSLKSDKEPCCFKMQLFGALNRGHRIPAACELFICLVSYFAYFWLHTRLFSV